MSALFLDPWHLIPRDALTYLTAVEIAPALLKVITVGSTIAIGGLVVIVAMTLLFGRIYCSTICPVGTLQDILIRITRKLNRRKRFKYYKSPHWLHYLILAVCTVAVLLGGSMIVGDLLEPFSNYGRLVTAFVLPPLLVINNIFAGLLSRFGIYLLYDIPLHIGELGMLLFTLVFFVTVAYLSMTEGRLFCNSFCPAGAILSLMSRVSVFKLVIKDDLCNDCGACDKVCKAECIDSGARYIDFSACVGCFNCLRSCPKDAIEYARRDVLDLTSASAEFNAGRREFFRKVGIPAAALLVAPGIAESGMIPTSQGKRQPISPPGSLSIRHFTGVCTACHLCVASCPTYVLRPSFLDYGLSGMSQPVMDYEAGFCNYECVICGEVCPTGAILQNSVEAKKQIQIGKAKFSKDDCIVVSKKKDCAACSEHCPTKAVHTIPYDAGLFLPEVDDELCVGCGACEHVCPVVPKKAISVTANPVHLIAKKPKPTPPAKSNSGGQSGINEFPF